ncbi:CopG family transcriptional regulator [Curvibacter sp. CHRR-16]|uniref:CopG family transcriptional regulator n=1 Tax=Curvibacter sp. CHRR-16 TaxID=2835872 RepID=UPI001BDB4849|nr:CopG family transcriptional regulator [Curvibacter sp. CHRR-16]MBT0571879.1 CopG family transcriptional regulator [Curvibacter sp. CHRR-16]
MAITKKPANQNTAEAFISGAPDAAAAVPEAPRRVRKGNKIQITLTISEPLLERADIAASQLGQTRAGFINLAIFQALESGLNVKGGA